MHQSLLFIHNYRAKYKLQPTINQLHYITQDLLCLENYIVLTLIIIITIY